MTYLEAPGLSLVVLGSSSSILLRMCAELFLETEVEPFLWAAGNLLLQ